MLSVVTDRVNKTLKSVGYLYFQMNGFAAAMAPWLAVGRLGPAPANA